MYFILKMKKSISHTQHHATTSPSPPHSHPHSLPPRTPTPLRLTLLDTLLDTCCERQEAGLERYAIAGQESDWDVALAGGVGSKKVPASGLLSVKRKAGAVGDGDEGEGGSERPSGKKKEKDGNRDRKSSHHGKSPKSHGGKSSGGGKNSKRGGT